MVVIDIIVVEEVCILVSSVNTAIVVPVVDAPKLALVNVVGVIVNPSVLLTSPVAMEGKNKIKVESDISIVY